MALVRRLTEEGRAAFRAWIEGGAEGQAPEFLLDEAAMSEAVGYDAIVDDAPFDTRLACGRHLFARLAKAPQTLRFDVGVWDWLSLFYIDQLLPSVDGMRKPKELVRYCLQLDNRKWSRHAIRMCWLSVATHGDHARIILTGAMDRGSDLQEQLAGRQEVFGARGIVAAADGLYWDDVKGAPKTGHATRTKGGVVQRLGVVMKQFALTYDVEAMSGAQVLDLLPREFERWKPSSEGAVTKPGVAAGVQVAL